MVRYERVENLTDEQWAAAHAAFYSLKLHRVMGGPTEYETPTLQAFYNKMMDELEAKRIYAWAILRDEEYIGHTILVSHQNEWEAGVALANEEDWGSGIGIRAILYALRFAFEELGLKQVIAFTNGADGKARDITIRGGFRPFFHFLMMPVEVWDAKWRGRVK